MKPALIQRFRLALARRLCPIRPARVSPDLCIPVQSSGFKVQGSGFHPPTPPTPWRLQVLDGIDHAFTAAVNRRRRRAELRASLIAAWNHPALAGLLLAHVFLAGLAAGLLLAPALLF